MDEQFETRPLLMIETLRALQQRTNSQSVLRLTLHLAAFATLIAAIIHNPGNLLLCALLTVALAWVWSGLFAPFHECVHATAFRSQRGNVLGAWLSGIPFLMPPAMYRTFHFEHHRHTQDVEKDPELAGDPRYQQWPSGLRKWLNMALGIGLIKLKLIPLFGFARQPRAQWHAFARWERHIPDAGRLILECRVVIAIWTTFLVAAIFWIPGGVWLLAAAWLTHVFQTLWVASEHTGLPSDGSILARTRTVISSPFVRWWLWNMNYHAEHHAWPSIPWHRLPNAHVEVREQLGSCVSGYGALHANIIRARELPSCDPA
jgi:fatty acid desaturase